MINLTRLRHVVAVDQAGSFSAAAAVVNVTQSALTKSVASVEDELGHRLFERRARGVTTTAEGRELVDRARRIISEFDLLIRDARRQRIREHNQLRIGVCPPAIEPFLAQPLARLASERPSLSLHLTALTSERALRFLKRGDFDVLLGPSDLFTRESQLATYPIGELEARLFARRNHPLAGQSALTKAQLKQYPIITPELFLSYAGMIEELYEDPGRDPHEMISVIDHFPLVTAIVRKSDRIGVVGGEHYLSPSFSRSFALLDIDFFAQNSFACATLRLGQPKPSAMVLIELLAEEWKGTFQLSYVRNVPD